MTLLLCLSPECSAYSREGGRWKHVGSLTFTGWVVVDREHRVELIDWKLEMGVIFFSPESQKTRKVMLRLGTLDS
jgi:hypothetical protein